MKKKYKLTDETKTLACGTVLHRIRAVRNLTLVDGTVVKAGDLGGWVEEEYNLSHGGSAWVSDDARVYDGSRVSGDARVGGNAHVFGRSHVFDNAQVYGDAEVGGYASIFDNARVYGSAEVGGYADVGGKALVKDIRDYSVYKRTCRRKGGRSSGMWLTYTRSDKMWRLGLFYGTGEELVAEAYYEGELSGRCFESIVRAQESIDKAIEEAKETK